MSECCHTGQLLKEVATLTSQAMPQGWRQATTVDTTGAAVTADEASFGPNPTLESCAQLPGAGTEFIGGNLGSLNRLIQNER